MPFCSYFGGTGKGTEVDLDGLLPDLNPLDDGFDDRALFFGREGGPPLVEVPRLGQDLVLSEELDLEEVDLTL